jgi:hypothetical protein
VPVRVRLGRLFGAVVRIPWRPRTGQLLKQGPGGSSVAALSVPGR